MTQDARNESYDNLLHKNVGFNNPGNIGYLGGLLGIGNENHSNIEGLRFVFFNLNVGGIWMCSD